MSEKVNTSKLAMDVIDTVWERIDPDVAGDEAVEWFVENVENVVLALICQYEGHSIVNDQCGIPSHRYCERCNNRVGTLGLTEELGRREPVGA